MKNPKISIIVPIYKVEIYLKKCIDSILAQTFTDFELILVDDGSPDSCGKICDEYAEKDRRIVVIHKSNGGQSSARNVGLDIAKGEYIGFVDSDDWIERDMYENLYNLVIKYKSDISIVGINFIYPNKIRKSKQYEVRIMDSKQAMYELIKHEIFGNYFCTKLFKKKLFNNTKFKENLIYEDIDLLYKLFHKAQTIVAKGVCKYNYLQRENSTVRNRKFKNDEFYVKQERLNFITENYPEFRELCELDLYETALANLGKIPLLEKENPNYNNFIALREYLNKNYKYTLRNKNILLKTKFLLLILKVSPKLYIFFLKLIKIKNERGKSC